MGAARLIILVRLSQTAFACLSQLFADVGQRFRALHWRGRFNNEDLI